jgi:hypothetical protein
MADANRVASLFDHLNAGLQERIDPFAAALDRLDTIPGVGRLTAGTLVAEIERTLAVVREGAGVR